MKKKLVIFLALIVLMIFGFGCSSNSKSKKVETNLENNTTKEEENLSSNDKFGNLLQEEKLLWIQDQNKFRLEEVERKKQEEIKRQEEEKRLAEERKRQAEEEYKRWHYKSNSLQIDIEPKSSSSQNIKYWIAHIKINNANQLKTSFQNDTFGGERETTSSITKRHNGILGVNASGFSFNTGKPSGLIIRDGKIYSGSKSTALTMAVKNDGTLYTPPNGTSAEQLVSEGVLHTFQFGPILIQNGQALSISDGKPSGNYPRTAIGQVSNNEYYIIVADGKRGDYSIGLTPKQMQDEFLQRGVKYAYNLDGGGSTALYFNGRLVNIPSDGSERPVADAIYFTN